jgi:hypothetical protein
MSHSPIFTDWSEQHESLFGKHPVRINHRLHLDDMFDDEALARLIERVPRDHYHVNTMSAAGTSQRTWREGQIGELSGEEVLAAVKTGIIWISLQRLQDIEPAYAGLLDAIYSEIEERVPGFKSYKRNLGLLISSPRAQVYYHCDIPGQSLWQVRGRKRVFIYPNTEPFLRQEHMETIVLGETDEEHMPYENWFDDHAKVYDLEPGEMLHWPVNSPHRVENLDCVNVSFTIEHWTNELRSSYAVHYANGVLRRLTGARSLAHNSTGAACHAKMALAAAVKYSGLRRASERRFNIDFEVDPRQSTGMRDIAAFDLGK